MVNKSKTKPMYGIGVQKDGKASKKSRKLSMSKRLAKIQKGGDSNLLVPYIDSDVTYAISLLYIDNDIKINGKGLEFKKGRDTAVQSLKLSYKLSDYKGKMHLLWGTSIGAENTFDNVIIHPGEQIKKKTDRHPGHPGHEANYGTYYYSYDIQVNLSNMNYKSEINNMAKYLKGDEVNNSKKMIAILEKCLPLQKNTNDSDMKIKNGRIAYYLGETLVGENVELYKIGNLKKFMIDGNSNGIKYDESKIPDIKDKLNLFAYYSCFYTLIDHVLNKLDRSKSNDKELFVELNKLFNKIIGYLLKKMLIQKIIQFQFTIILK